MLLMLCIALLLLSPPLPIFIISTQSLAELKEEISAKRQLISTLSRSSLFEAISNARHQQILGQKEEEEYELTCENYRTAAVVRQHE